MSPLSGADLGRPVRINSHPPTPATPRHGLDHVRRRCARPSRPPHQPTAATPCCSRPIPIAAMHAVRRRAAAAGRLQQPRRANEDARESPEPLAGLAASAPPRIRRPSSDRLGASTPVVYGRRGTVAYWRPGGVFTCLIRVQSLHNKGPNSPCKSQTRWPTDFPRSVGKRPQLGSPVIHVAHVPQKGALGRRLPPPPAQAADNRVPPFLS